MWVRGLRRECGFFGLRRYLLGMVYMWRRKQRWCGRVLPLRFPSCVILSALCLVTFKGVQGKTHPRVHPRARETTERRISSTQRPCRTG